MFFYLEYEIWGQLLHTHILCTVDINDELILKTALCVSVTSELILKWCINHF